MSDFQTMIECTKLTKSFQGRPAVCELDLSIRAGQIFALMGPNGAGKSTTINMLLGFLRPDEGEISLAGINPVASPQAIVRATAYVPENVVVYPMLTAIENLIYFSRLSGNRLSHELASAQLDEVELDRESHGKLTGRFSKGMRQKVGLAIALAKRSPVLILDEPLSGLDPASGETISRCVKQAAERGAAVLMVTHDVFRACEIADQIAILSEGRLCSVLDPHQSGPSEIFSILNQRIQGRVDSQSQRVESDRIS